MIRSFCLLALLWAVSSDAFVSHPTRSSLRTLRAIYSSTHDETHDSQSHTPQSPRDSTANHVVRRHVLTGLGTAMTVFLVGGPSSAVAADEDESSFAAIAARAGQLSKEVDKENAQAAANIRKSEKTAYDWTLPMEGQAVNVADIIKQEFYDDGVKVKAIVVVNIKQDDPVARKAIPELISLATKYGRDRDGALAIVCCPTDQGYYEPDTSALIRLKLASEYGYGIQPATIVTDKVNLLGTGAVPFWRWLQSTCRTPAGLGRIEGNFEKFLLDGLTGLPLRRYPRRYAPLNMGDDIEAVISGRPLPPARANYLEEWRQAAAEAERDTYRFQKGVNVFDQ